MKKLFGVVALIVGVLGGALIIGVQRSVPRQINVAPAAPIQIDIDAAAQRLGRAIRHRTVSPIDSASQAEFERFHAFLTESFPAFHQRLARETVNQHSLLYTWQGTRTELKPILLLAHIDVVPAAEDSPKWRFPPFAGKVADGYIWGRGALDDKGSLMASLEAIEWLIKQGYRPERTLYLAFGHDEEIGGDNGAATIAATLAARNVQLEYVLDEGMNILSGIIDGVTVPVALIGIAEKGYLSIELTATAAGGHSSIPANDNAIASVTRALQRLEAAPFPANIRGPTRAMFEFLGPEMGWTAKLVLANLWLFEPLVVHQLAGSPLINAILRTTMAPTMFNSGVKDNVLPTHARAVINLRIMPGETTADALAQVREIIDDPKVKLNPLATRIEPSTATDIESPSFQLLARTIRQITPQSIVAPALLVAATDSRHYAGLTRSVLRFLPITITAADTNRFHGIDERISVDDYLRCINFYTRLIQNSQSQLLR